MSLFLPRKKKDYAIVSVLILSYRVLFVYFIFTNVVCILLCDRCNLCMTNDI